MNKLDRESFIVGCDSGGLFKCSFSNTEIVNSKWEDEFPVELKSPVQFTFDSQFGPIYSINYSPFHRNLILTCGTDSEIKLYSILQTDSLVTFCPENGYLYDIEWSPIRPCVFACASNDGNLLLYDLMENGKETCQATKASDGSLYSLNFNQSRPELLATGDSLGVVKIWKLSSKYCKSSSSELYILNEISEKPFEKS